MIKLVLVLFLFLVVFIDLVLIESQFTYDNKQQRLKLSNIELISNGYVSF
ncbi:hypothetical protein MACH09_26920 [Vibrio sp. MACH09]|nr:MULTISPECIES: hypothetical protein [unclassified Vibrio]GLO62184.1 hypothetical protein MACH09_26920 [Vibrio sp. MACH09]